MPADCSGCKEAHEKISKHDARIAALEAFKKWATPILEDIKTIKNDSRWQIAIAIIFSAIVTYVYTTQIFPFFDKQNKDKLEIMTAIHKEKIETIKALQSIKTYDAQQLQALEEKINKKVLQVASDINKHSTEASKMNYKGIKKVIRKEVEESINDRYNSGYYGAK